MAAERYRNRMHTGSYYTYGNVAYELQPEYSPYRIREEEEERRKEEARAEKAEARENRIVSVKMIAVALVLFIGCIGFMGMNVLVDHAEVTLRQQKNDLDNLKAANAILEAEMAEQLDMDYIKTEATERLGMSEPQSYQVVYIDVPKQSYTVQHNADDAAEGASILAKVTNIWKD